MRPFAFALILFAASPALALPVGRPASEPQVQLTHGCHQGWARGERGWHRHGPACEPREGLAGDGRRKSRARRRAAA